MARKAHRDGADREKDEEGDERERDLVVKMGEDALPVGRVGARLDNEVGKGAVAVRDEFLERGVLFPGEFGKGFRFEALLFLELPIGVAGEMVDKTACGRRRVDFQIFHVPDIVC